MSITNVLHVSHSSKQKGVAAHVWRRSAEARHVCPTLNPGNETFHFTYATESKNQNSRLSCENSLEKRSHDIWFKSQTGGLQSWATEGLVIIACMCRVGVQDVCSFRRRRVKWLNGPKHQFKSGCSENGRWSRWGWTSGAGLPAAGGSWVVQLVVLKVLKVAPALTHNTPDPTYRQRGRVDPWGRRRCYHSKVRNSERPDGIKHYDFKLIDQGCPLVVWIIPD